MAPTTAGFGYAQLSLILPLLWTKKWKVLSHAGEEHLNPRLNSFRAGSTQTTEATRAKEGVEGHEARKWLDTASGSQQTQVSEWYLCSFKTGYFRLVSFDLSPAIFFLP